MELFRVVDYEDLKEGEPILAFGVHVLSWNFDQMGQPRYGIVPDLTLQNEILSGLKDIVRLGSEFNDVSFQLVEIANELIAKLEA